MGETKKETDKRCRVGKAVGKLTPAEQRDMQAIFDNGTASHIISVWFERYRNTRLSADAITKHRRKVCTCYSEDKE